MKIERALSLRNLAASSIRSVYALALTYGPLSSAMDSDVRRVMDSTHAAKAPQWVRSYLDGYTQALRDNLYSSGELVFGGVYQGRFYSTHNHRANYYGKHGIAASAFADDGNVKARGHYWARFEGVKPYFLSPSAQGEG